MAIETTTKTAFLFNTYVNGIPYGFQIFAANETEARQQLIVNLQQVVRELEEVKAGTKAS